MTRLGWIAAVAIGLAFLVACRGIRTQSRAAHHQIAGTYSLHETNPEHEPIPDRLTLRRNGIAHGSLLSLSSVPLVGSWSLRGCKLTVLLRWADEPPASTWRASYRWEPAQGVLRGVEGEDGGVVLKRER